MERKLFNSKYKTSIAQKNFSYLPLITISGCSGNHLIFYSSKMKKIGTFGT